MSKSSFTGKEQKRFRMKKYLREHAVEYGVEWIVQIAFVSLVVFLCGRTQVAYGIGLACAYMAGKILNDTRLHSKV